MTNDEVPNPPRRTKEARMTNPQSKRPDDKPYDLEERTARFGEAIIEFAKKIPVNPVTVRLIEQSDAGGLGRASVPTTAKRTMPCPKYSVADFRHSGFVIPSSLGISSFVIDR